MNAKQMIMDYVAKHNNGKVYTDEQFAGKMATEGITIARNGDEQIIAKLTRSGKQITVTETTITPTPAGHSENIVTIFTASL